MLLCVCVCVCVCVCARARTHVCARALVCVSVATASDPSRTAVTGEPSDSAAGALNSEPSLQSSLFFLALGVLWWLPWPNGVFGGGYSLVCSFPAAFFLIQCDANFSGLIQVDMCRLRVGCKHKPAA